MWFDDFLFIRNNYTTLFLFFQDPSQPESTVLQQKNSPSERRTVEFLFDSTVSVVIIKEREICGLLGTAQEILKRSKIFFGGTEFIGKIIRQRVALILVPYRTLPFQREARTPAGYRSYNVC